jgi:hypothetical protein
MNNGNTLAAVQYYTEQVRQEMRECGTDKSVSQNQKSQVNQIDESLQENVGTNASLKNAENANNVKDVSTALANLHLGRINEIDAGNEADTEESELNKDKTLLGKVKKTLKKQSSSTDSNEEDQSKE